MNYTILSTVWRAPTLRQLSVSTGPTLKGFCQNITSMFTYPLEVNADWTAAVQTSPAPPSGKADHIFILLLQTYKQRLRQDKPVLHNCPELSDQTVQLSRTVWDHRRTGTHHKAHWRHYAKINAWSTSSQRPRINGKVHFNLVECDPLPTDLVTWTWDWTPPSAAGSLTWGLATTPPHWPQVLVSAQTACYLLHLNYVKIRCSTILGLINDGDESANRQEVKVPVSWCYDNNLYLIINKTKKIILDNRKLQEATTSLLFQVLWCAHFSLTSPGLPTLKRWFDLPAC